MALRALMLERAREVIRRQVAPRFWSFFDDYVSEQSVSSDQALWISKAMLQAMAYIHSAFSSLWSLLEGMEEMIAASDGSALEPRVQKKEFQLLFNAVLFSDAKEHFQLFLREFFRMLFRVREAPQDDSELDPSFLAAVQEDLKASGVTLGQKLDTLGWFGIVEEAFSSTVYEEIDAKMTQVCSFVFEQPVLDDFLGTIEVTVLPWLHDLLQYNGNGAAYQQWETRLKVHVFEVGYHSLDDEFR